MRCQGCCVGSILVSALLVFCPTTSGQEPNRPAVVVLVYNYAKVPAQTMNASTARAAEAFRDAGIDIEWINPIVDRAFLVSPTSNSLMRFTVQMLIKPRKWPPHMEPTTDWIMGRAFPAAANGGTLWLFYDQIVNVARENHQSRDRILALTMAHEIGHLLLPYPGHSPTGVMRAEWGWSDLRRTFNAAMRFTPDQASEMRTRTATCCAAIRERMLGSRTSDPIR